MTDEARKAFLAQFETSKRSVEGWPEWMRESASVASASFPRPQPEATDSSSPRQGSGQSAATED